MIYLKVNLGYLNKKIYHDWGQSIIKQISYFETLSLIRKNYI